MIAVVILNWNGVDMLRRYLPGVVSDCAGEGEVIVADNGSTDDSLHYLRTEHPDVRLVCFDQNLGFAGGYNAAFRRIEQETPGRYDYYLLLNSDVRTSPGWLTPMRTYMDAHPETAAAQPKIHAEWAHDSFEHAGAAGGFIDRFGYPFCRGRLLNVLEKDSGQYDTVRSLFWATGAALMVRPADWNAAGGFDARFFAHFEEIDFCWRLRARARKIVCVTDSVVYHVGGGTLPADNPRKTYLNFRNSLTMLYKNLPDDELQHVLSVRKWLDAMAWFKFFVSGDFANAKAVRRARKDFHKWQHQFDPERKKNLENTTLFDIPERIQRSLIYAFYVQGKKTFAQFMS